MVEVYRGAVVTPELVIDDGLVVAADGVITWVGPVAQAPTTSGAVPVPEPTNHYLLPGLVDLHNHGGGGQSFPDATSLEQVRTAVDEHRRYGTAHVVASLVTAAPATLLERVSLLAEAADEGLIAGIHVEGPFLSTARCGAQDPSLIIDGDVELTQQLLQAGRGQVVTMTVAPEVAGMLGEDGVVQALVSGGALPSWGHTDADAATMRASAQWGASVLAAAAAPRSRRATVTHLCNGMRPMHHRDPGPVPAALALAATGDVVVELIGDGTHLAPELVREFFALVGANNIALVTDAMAAAGMADGMYHLGTQQVSVVDGVARLADGGSIAGGTAHLLDVVRCAVEAGVGIVDAVRSASLVPASVLGERAGAPIGALAAGYRADIVVADRSLRAVRCGFVGDGADGTRPRP